MLSGDAKADLENQLVVNGNDIRAVRDLLDSTPATADAPSAICPGETPLAADNQSGAAAS